MHLSFPNRNTNKESMEVMQLIPGLNQYSNAIDDINMLKMILCSDIDAFTMLFDGRLICTKLVAECECVCFIVRFVEFALLIAFVYTLHGSYAYRCVNHLKVNCISN